MERIQRALLSVSDKAELAPLAQALAASGIELISTGGTARALREAGLKVTDLSAYTGFPEMLDGRVKTLHPKVHAGLLYLRGNAAHQTAVARHGIKPIDLVVVNLYPFEQTVAKPNVSLEEAIENIDIGGPSMLRSAAKNHQSVTVLLDPSDYPAVAQQVKETGNTTLELRRKLAAKVFARTAAYDAAIAAHLSQAFATIPSSPLPASLLIQAPLIQSLRYGENPHQMAALYGQFHDFFQQLHLGLERWRAERVLVAVKSHIGARGRLRIAPGIAALHGLHRLDGACDRLLGNIRGMCVADRLALHGTQAEALRGVVGRLLEAAIVEHQHLGLAVFQKQLAIVCAFKAALEQRLGAALVEAAAGNQAQGRIGHGRLMGLMI